MKKTALLFLLAGSVLYAEEPELLTYSSSDTAGNYNSTMHGFYLALDADTLNTPATLTDQAHLLSFTTIATSGYGELNKFGYIVLDSENTILGFSDVQQLVRLEATTYTFKGVDGEALTLSSHETYRYLTVSEDVSNALTSADTAITLFKYSSSKSACTTSTQGNVMTISGGLVAAAMRGFFDASGAAIPDNSVLITGANGLNKNTTLTPLFSEIKVQNIPEPATATLSLLALAGLCARRRR